jgi:hypothetical protein
MGKGPVKQTPTSTSNEANADIDLRQTSLRGEPLSPSELNQIIKEARLFVAYLEDGGPPKEFAGRLRLLKALSKNGDIPVK